MSICKKRFGASLLAGVLAVLAFSAAPPALASGAATPTSSAVLVNDRTVAFDAYNINDSNYFKLRDLAFVLAGSEKQFDVAWDGASDAILLASGKLYTPVGGEMAGKGAGRKAPVATTSKILLDGKEMPLAAYNIDGYNYFKLRDVAAALDFGVTWDVAAQRIMIDTGTGYVAEQGDSQTDLPEPASSAVVAATATTADTWEKLYREELDTLFAGLWEGSPFVDSIPYAICDIDRNGVPEIFLYEGGYAMRWYGLYTVIDGELFRYDYDSFYNLAYTCYNPKAGVLVVLQGSRNGDEINEVRVSGTDVVGENICVTIGPGYAPDWFEGELDHPMYFVNGEEVTKAEYDRVNAGILREGEIEWHQYKAGDEIFGF